MGELHIEPAQEKDIPGMLALWKDTPGLGWGAGDDEESLAAFMQKNPQTCLVLKEGNSVWGTVLGGFDGRRGYIYHLVVDKDFRRQSYGKKLLQEVVGELERLNAEKIHLFVLRSNSEVVGFYEKQGWIKRKDIEVLSLDLTNYREKR
jgi:ribosomal protein S18 acetylase RimI-like enzyme